MRDVILFCFLVCTRGLLIRFPCRPPLKDGVGCVRSPLLLALEVCVVLLCLTNWNVGQGWDLEKRVGNDAPWLHHSQHPSRSYRQPCLCSWPFLGVPFFIQLRPPVEGSSNKCRSWSPHRTGFLHGSSSHHSTGFLCGRRSRAR